jgi:acetoin utilization deacetylase AcuC-like enzyme
VMPCLIHHVLFIVMLLCLFPLAIQFGPELILVSAGYDSALGDEKVVYLIL